MDSTWLLVLGRTTWSCVPLALRRRYWVSVSYSNDLLNNVPSLSCPLSYLLIPLSHRAFRNYFPRKLVTHKFLSQGKSKISIEQKEILAAGAGDAFLPRVDAFHVKQVSLAVQAPRLYLWFSEILLYTVASLQYVQDNFLKKKPIFLIEICVQKRDETTKGSGT